MSAALRPHQYVCVYSQPAVLPPTYPAPRHVMRYSNLSPLIVVEGGGDRMEGSTGVGMVNTTRVRGMQLDEVK